MSPLSDWLPLALVAAFLFSLIFIVPDDPDPEAPTLDDLLPSYPQPTALDRYLGPDFVRYECFPLILIDSS